MEASLIFHWSLQYLDHFSIFQEAWYFWVVSNQFFFNLFWFLMLLFHEINQIFFLLFKQLIRFIKLGLEFSLKVFFIRLSFRSVSDHFIFNVFWWELVCLHSFFSLEFYQLFFWLIKVLIIWINLLLKISLNVTFIR